MSRRRGARATRADWDTLAIASAFTRKARVRVGLGVAAKQPAE